MTVPPYKTDQERKYKRELLNRAFDEWLKRNREKDPLDPESIKSSSITAIAKEFKIGRSTCSMYFKHKRKELNEAKRNDSGTDSAS